MNWPTSEFFQSFIYHDSVQLPSSVLPSVRCISHTDNTGWDREVPGLWALMLEHVGIK